MSKCSVSFVTFEEDGNIYTFIEESKVLSEVEKARQKVRDEYANPLTEDDLLKLMREHLHPLEVNMLCKTVWKDGINLEEPAFGIVKFAAAIRSFPVKEK